MSSRRVHYILSSHWDREWYQSFQDFRYRLCHLMNRVIDGLEDGRLAGPFTTDGQAIILEDYLEVYPQKQKQIETLVREGKLIVGPWYVLPDEFLVSGEAMIRNIRLGRQIARDLGGEPSSAGFVCDLFGHIGQLPQIVAGFGITAGFVWRGVNHEGPKLLKWRSPDGSEMLCYRFGLHGYCGYAINVRQAAPSSEACKADPARSMDKVRSQLLEVLKYEANVHPTGPILLFDGGDHQCWDEQAYEVIRERLGSEKDGYQIIHSTLDEYLKDLQKIDDQVSEVVVGELREPALHSIVKDNQWLIPGVLSSRVQLKQANVKCQNLLTHWAEPMGVMAHAWLGAEYPADFLRVAWRWLLQNHPHDSIGGCSIDRVHQDMVYRFSQCEQIGHRLVTEAQQTLSAHVEGELEGDDLRVVVFNPLPVAVNQSIELTLPLPTSWPVYPSHGGIMREVMFHVYEADGMELPVQMLSHRWNRSHFRTNDIQFPQHYVMNEAKVSLPVSIEAMGYTTLRIRGGKIESHERVKRDPTLVTSHRSMENDTLEVTILPQGTLRLLDKRSGEVYHDLLIYENTADTGDGWYFGQTIGDETHMTGMGQASISLVHDGPYLATFCIRQTLKLPAHFETGDSWKRSDLRREQIIDTYVTLRAGVDHVEVETVIDNVIDDHRMRVLLPTGVSDAETYFADAAFDVVERPIAMRGDNHRYREPEVDTKPQQTWTAVTSSRRGLAVISEGLHESAVRDQPDRPIALTLYRSTHKTVLTNGEPDGQLHQTLRFRYWIQPLTGELNPSQLFLQGQMLGCGIHSAMLFAKDVQHRRTNEKRLPASASFLQIDGDVVLSAMEQRQGGTEVRLFNPNEKSTTAVLRWPGDVTPAPSHCQPVDFEGNPQGQPVPVVAGQCEISIAAKKIVTLRLQ